MRARKTMKRPRSLQVFSPDKPRPWKRFFVLKATKTRTGSITIEATPKNEMLSQFVAKAVLTGRTHVETVRIEGNGGETTLILFSDVKATK